MSVQRLREEAEAAARAATAARRSVVLAGKRYEGGVDNYLNLLDAQRTQLDAELQESQLQQQQRVAVVRLYRALGGGWDPRIAAAEVGEVNQRRPLPLPTNTYPRGCPPRPGAPDVSHASRNAGTAT